MSARLQGRLTAKEVQHAAKRGLYPDGQGLCFQIARNGSRSWIMRYRIGGRRRYLGLGVVRDVTLAEARQRAATARALLQAGHDPIEARQGRRTAVVISAAKSMSFSEAATAFIQAHSVAAKSVAQWTASINTYVNPVFGALPVASVDTGLVLRAIEPLWSTKTETASRLRARIERILDWAKTRGYRDAENPARWDGHLENLLRAKSKVIKVVHHAALPYDELPAFMDELRRHPGTAARALEFAILTAARSGEVFGARWEEIDLQAKVWTVPGVRMKSGRDHRVPLSSQAMGLLSALPGRTGIVFQSPRAGYPLAKMAMLGVLERMGRSDDATPHGFRSTFRDWTGDRTAFARDLIEAALAHAIGDKTEAAYRRTDALEKRRLLMEQWADFCAGKVQPSAEVIELRRA
jgi:integrase